MCGLVGVLPLTRSGFYKTHIDNFQTLLYLDALRGDDSTGVMGIDHLGNVKILKEATEAADYLRNPQVKSFLEAQYASGKGLFGHNRKATRGNIVDKNAHPFIAEEKIVLMHNGTFYGDHKHHKDTEVDSEALAHIIANSTDLEKSFQAVNAAYATIWYNIEDKTINMIHNGERPFHYMETDDAIYFASEWQMLDFIQTRNNLLKKGKPAVSMSLKEYFLMTFTLSKDGSWTEEGRLLDAKYRPVQTFRQEYDKDEYEYWKKVRELRNREYAAYWEDIEYSELGAGAPPFDSNRSVAEFPPQSGGSRSPELTSTEVDVFREKIFLRLPEQKAFSIADWNLEIIKSYGSGRKVIVTVDDLFVVKLDSKMEATYLWGTTADDNKVPVMFQVSDTLSQVMAGPDKPVFEVTIDQQMWKKIPGEDELGRPFFMAKKAHHLDGITLINKDSANA